MKERLLMIIGLALYWPMLTGCKVIIQAYAESSQEANVLALVYFCAIIAFATAYLFSHQLAERILINKKLVLGLGIVATASLTPGAFLPHSQTMSLICIAPSIFLCAAMFCLLTIGWGAACLSPGYENLRAFFAVSVALSFLVGYALPIAISEFFPSMDAVLPIVSPRNIVRVLSPVLCAAALCYFSDMTPPPQLAHTIRAGNSQSASPQLLWPSA